MNEDNIAGKLSPIAWLRVSVVAFLLIIPAAYCMGRAEVESRLTCFEDEVIVWTGEAHDECVPLDDLREMP